jgi:acyl dehydratase
MTDRSLRALDLDDIAVGDTFESSAHRLDAEQIVAFASAFDPQPFHIDAVAAEDTFFKGLAASGWHTGAISMRLIVESVPFADGIIGAGGEIVWPTPTRAGDVLRVRSEVLEITPSRSRPNRAIALVRSVTSNEEGEVRQEFTSRMLVFRKEV